MSQAALFPSELIATAAAANEHPLDRIGFEIGWDHAHYRLVPPAEHLHQGHPVRQGWQAGQAVFGARTFKPTPGVKAWLGLRLTAWLRGQAFEGLQVTPHFMAQLSADTCPVTRQRLTQDTGADTDAVVERVNAQAAFAAGNLAWMSRRAAHAKAGCDWQDALRFADEIDSGRVDRIAGLNAAEWQRLGALMSLATPLKHAEVASLPLLVLPPNRLRLLNPVQALQTLVTLLFTRPAYARQMMELAALMPGSVARQAFQVFMHTLLARRVAAGPQPDARALRGVLQQAWLHPLVQRRWQRLALSLREADCEHLVQLAVKRGLWGAEGRWLPRHAATEGWALDSRGRVAAPCEAANDAAAAAPSTDVRRAFQAERGAGLVLAVEHAHHDQRVPAVAGAHAFA
jgi:hypothetical protein